MTDQNLPPSQPINKISVPSEQTPPSQQDAPSLTSAVPSTERGRTESRPTLDRSTVNKTGIVRPTPPPPAPSGTGPSPTLARPSRPSGPPSSGGSSSLLSAPPPFRGGGSGGRRELPRQDRPPINDYIKAPQLRLISSSGEQLGIVDTPEALRMALEENLDLVVIGFQDPPVAKILNYGKYKFEKEKQDRENKKKTKQQSVLKEIKMSVRIDDHDLNVKVKSISGWLDEGCKVRVAVQMRGREAQHPEIGKSILHRIIELCAPSGKPDKLPAIREEGRFFTINLTPLLKKP